MSVARQVIVRVPGSPREDALASAPSHWLTASFTLDATRPHRVERGGSLRDFDKGDEDDLLIVAFGAACASVGIGVPSALRCRAVSEIPIGAGQGASAAAIVAGVVGARALLDLPFDDVAAERIAAALDGSPRQARAALEAHVCSIQSVCDDSAPNAADQSAPPLESYNNV